MQNEVIEETITAIWREIQATQLASGTMMHKIVQDAAKVSAHGTFVCVISHVPSFFSSSRPAVHQEAIV